MKMILAICPEERTKELRSYIELHDIHHYSALHDVTGKGDKGAKFDNRIMPGTSTLIAIVVPDQKKIPSWKRLENLKIPFFPRKACTHLLSRQRKSFKRAHGHDNHPQGHRF